MRLTVEMLDRICGHTRYKTRKAALVAFLDTHGYTCSRLGEPHVMAQFLAQVLHESGRMRYIKEVWGPTAAQRRYEGRKDLGNTQKGDGKRFSGLDLIQVTGRYNFRALTKWVRSTFGVDVDFEANPQSLADPKWLGVGALWYWTQRVPQKYVDTGNVEMVSVRVNGGRNGLADRLTLYRRSALVLLGYSPTDVTGFQSRAGLFADGVDGPETRAALHDQLSRVVSPKPVPQTAQNEAEAPTPAPRRPSIIAALFAALRSIFGKGE